MPIRRKREPELHRQLRFPASTCKHPAAIKTYNTPTDVPGDLTDSAPIPVVTAAPPTDFDAGPN